MSNKLSRSSLLAGAAGCLFGLSGTANAQEVVQSNETTQTNNNPVGDSAEKVDGEIVVTAQRREESLQDVPISMTVLSGEYLDGFTQPGTLDALAMTPGLTIDQSLTNGGNKISLRGVAAGSSFYAGTGPVAYYLDGVPFGFVKSAYVPDTGSFDLERIEILRGPQGTLYGASALGGVVRALTHQPLLNRSEVKARAALATTEDGGTSYRGDLAVNVPLIEDKLGLRVVGGYNYAAGWIDYPNLDEEDLNDAESYYLRARLKAQPTDRTTIGLSGWLSRKDAGAFSVGNPDEEFPGVNDTSGYEDFDTFSLTLDHEFTGFTATSVTSYIDYRSRYVFDYRPLFEPLGHLGTNYSSEVFAQELSLRSNSQGPWRWTLGAFYRDAADFLKQDGNYLGQTVIDYTDSSESVAVFGELTRVLFGGKVELTGGLRYFVDKVSQRENRPFDGDPSRPLENVSTTFKHLSPRALVNWFPSEDITVYASYGRGFRSGANQQALVTAVAPDVPPAKEDTLTNYELGSKGRLFGGFLNYDVSIYYLDWQDVQQTVLADLQGNYPCATQPCFFLLLNGISASGAGLDVALDFNISNRLRISPTFSWNDLKWDETVPGFFEKGARAPYSVKYTLGGSASYTVPLGWNGLEAVVSASGQYSPAPDVIELGTAEDKLMVNAALAVGNDRWTARLYADNLTDERYTSGGFPGVDGILSNYNFRQRPRTIGLQFEYGF